MGKTILAACFITDLGTVMALGVCSQTSHLAAGLCCRYVDRALVHAEWTQFIITRLGATRVSEPEVKFIFFILFFSADWLQRRRAKPSCPHI